ncbi:MAG: cell division/cell wall cluster transcriptional repressor MraZ [Lysobacterales bacterium 69-70]|nr:division/cell wall cluster transcriptional repressor MraZ [Xanthomonadaceae bacterium]ODU36454.1 MAG: cell division/cell wall cluster transcriptional repressor MraZ [Xanthomonadaceae bacterium SCN 69-320]ODV21800.1 MAG: cell division/cell wall cluster transcriptional repressor MraZ [Xanthomonadaceae bacterium SCN 69-25]OJY96000.1 MAG: cell division/cell wall cluster transcriptional repressor MraZ [Xanthomonadales bacterium 69-70]
MLTGETAITIDDKGRLAVPTAYRELIAQLSGGRLVFTYNPFETGCLWLFPLNEWETVRDQVNELPNVKAVHRALQMKLVGAAAHVEPDGAGRILVPASQRMAAGIEKKAVLLGMGTKFELWSEQAHLAKIRQTIGEDEISDAMMNLRL